MNKQFKIPDRGDSVRVRLSDGSITEGELGSGNRKTFIVWVNNEIFYSVLFPKAPNECRFIGLPCETKVIEK